MKERVRRLALIAAVWALLLVAGGCDVLTGPDKEGEFVLSSQLFGAESYYLFGYSYEDGEQYRYPYAGERIPDIINEGYLVIQGLEQVSLPGFNTPAQMNGFALLGTFPSLEEARDFYSAYKKVEEGLQFETVSDTVELFQVWVQLTEAGNYVKMLIKDIADFTVETGRPYNEVTLQYTYQPDGSTTFPK